MSFGRSLSPPLSGLHLGLACVLSSYHTIPSIEYQTIPHKIKLYHTIPNYTTLGNMGLFATNLSIGASKMSSVCLLLHYIILQHTTSHKIMLPPCVKLYLTSEHDAIQRTHNTFSHSAAPNQTPYCTAYYSCVLRLQNNILCMWHCHHLCHLPSFVHLRIPWQF